MFARFACSARGGGYTIRTLRVLSASVAASASYTIRTLRVLSASAAASYTVRTLRVLRAALLRSEHTDNTQTNTRHRCLFFISKDIYTQCCRQQAVSAIKASSVQLRAK